MENLEVEKYTVIGNFMSDTIYIIYPYCNHVRFYRVFPNIVNSRTIIEFLEGNKDCEGNFIEVFQADCIIEGHKLKCIRSDYGQYWETSIDINLIEIDENFT